MDDMLAFQLTPLKWKIWFGGGFWMSWWWMECFFHRSCSIMLTHDSYGLWFFVCFRTRPFHGKVRYWWFWGCWSAAYPAPWKGSLVVKLYFVQLLLLLSCCQFLGRNLKTDVEVPAVCGFRGWTQPLCFWIPESKPTGGEYFVRIAFHKTCRINSTPAFTPKMPQNYWMFYQLCFNFDLLFSHPNKNDKVEDYQWTCC